MKKITQVLTASLAVATMGVGVPGQTELKTSTQIQEQAPKKKRVTKLKKNQINLIAKYMALFAFSNTFLMGNISNIKKAKKK